jgi:hypothetical protein
LILEQKENRSLHQPFINSQHMLRPQELRAEAFDADFNGLKVVRPG